MNVQVVADPAGNLLWILPALSGRTHDLAAARTHRVIRICERQGIPVLADRAYIGAGSWVTTPIRQLPRQDLSPTQRTVNRGLRRETEVLHALRKARASLNRMTAIVAAVPTLESQR
ncbi:hypothetical protein GCM10023237_68960 [Streptomyces coeruleoprunus]